MNISTHQHTAICTGSFDPPSNGHLNIISRGLVIFEKIIIAIAINTSKQAMFPVEERVQMLKEIFQNEPRVEVESFSGLLVNYCKEKKVKTILRGIRNMSDYEYESQMALANKSLYPELETLFMMTEGKYVHLSSSIIKEVIHFGGSGKDMLHPIVEAKMKEKLADRVS